MSEGKATYTVSAAAAAVMKGDAPPEEKMRAARGEIPLPPPELVLVLVFLMQSSPPLAATARATLEGLGDTVLREAATYPGAHPRVLHVMAQVLSGKDWLLDLLSAHPRLDPRTAEAIAAVREPADIADAFPEPEEPEPAEPVEEPEPECEPEAEGLGEEGDYQNKYQLAMSIGISDKIKFAMSGDKEWRSIMLKDPNKLVSGAVLKNPRITDQEILAIAKSTMVNEEVVRVICINKDWIKNYQIRKALVENNKTPLPTALRFMATLTEKDLAMLAKSKNVSSVISTQARKSLQNLQKRR